jgi:translation elongation factor EF-Tu-like GTPase
MRGMTPWRFSVTDSFTITGRGPAVGGHIDAGTVHPGDRFRMPRPAALA